MSVITNIRIPAEEFELGEILALCTGMTVTLESMIPLGQTAVPFFWVNNDPQQDFIEAVQPHPSVSDLQVVETHDCRTLFSHEWAVTRDHFFDGLVKTGAQLLSATGTKHQWEFELRFPSHDQLSAFKTHCEYAHVPLEVLRVFNSTRPDTGPYFGLSQLQREALILAVHKGYYSLPRRCSTKDIATELGISGQAVTERLRRGIETLVTNAIVETPPPSE